MTIEDETNCDIYLRAKVDQINDAEKLSVFEKIFSDPQPLSYYTILSYGLLFPCTPSNLKRLKELFYIFFETDQISHILSDRPKAILTSVCNYWGEAALFEEELKAVIEQWDFDYFPDACITATSSFALLTFSTKSLARLQYLKDQTVKRLGSVEEFEQRLLVMGCITATTGELLERRELTERYLKKSALQELAFVRTS